MIPPEPASVGDRAHPDVESSRSIPTALGPVQKIQARHVERLAIVYVRQSTLQQVACNRESTALQYDLARYASAWGWPRDRILIIDEDLGQRLFQKTQAAALGGRL